MKKRLLACLSILLALIFTLNSCGGKKNSPTPNEKGLLNVCLGKNTQKLDPAYATDRADGSLILHLFEGLYVMGDEQKPVLAQAASCDVDESGLIYTFVLKDKLKWNNGESLDVTDFVYAWNRAASIEGDKGRADLFDIIARDEEGELKLETPNNKTLLVTLKNPTPYFKELLTLPQFCPVDEKMINYDSENWSIKPDACVGNGAYKLSEIIESSHIALEKNEHYRDANAVKTEKINFISMTRGTAYDSFMAGEILFADRVPNTRISEASKRDDYYNKASFGSYYLLFNPNIEPLKDVSVREALMLAIDRNYITKELSKDTNRPAAALVPPGLMKNKNGQDFRSQHGEFFDPTAHEENLERAKSFLKEAGYFDEGKEFPILKYQYNKSSEHTLIAKAIQHMWAEIGVTLHLEEVEWDIGLQNAKSSNFQIFRSGWMCDWNEPSAILQNFKTNNNFNISGFSNTKYDELLNAAALETEPDKRSNLFYEAEKTLLETWTVCPLFYYSDTYMQSEYLTGVKVNPFEYKSFIGAEIIS